MRAELDRKIRILLNASFIEGTSEVIEMTSLQLDEYFEGQRRDFDIPLLPAGTEFQKRVWEALLTIPYGETTTYAALAGIVGNDRAVRAVAAANGANMISIIIPCHRVIGSGGELVGYAGGLESKKKLLNLETGTRLQYELF